MMWPIPQLFLSLLALLHDSPQWKALVGSSTVSKRIAIVGGGTAGMTTLKTLVGNLPEEQTRDWDIVLFEQRDGIGGVWLQESSPTPQPPQVPETPLYPGLRANTPHPSMTLAHFTYPPETNLFPRHPVIQDYHQFIVDHWNLTSYIRLNHEVLESRWIGDSEHGRWQLAVRDRELNKTFESSFDHLIIASGHYHDPYEPDFQGSEHWLEEDSQREIIHSIYYRYPEDFAGRNVVVVGGGASGQDIAQRIVDVANSTYMSLKSETALIINNTHSDPIPGVGYIPQIRRFTTNSVIFANDTTKLELSHIDTIVLATGYNQRVPFLTVSGHLDEVKPNDYSTEHLTNNFRYIRPLYRHLLSLDPSYPLGSLYFIGLPIFVANFPSDSAQALFTAHTIADPSLLDSRSSLLADLTHQESSLKNASYTGHRLYDSVKYQDGLITHLQERGRAGWPGIPPVGHNFTENWRVFCLENPILVRKAWFRVESLGKNEVSKWLDGVSTEEDWDDLMKRLVDWEKKQESKGLQSL